MPEHLGVWLIVATAVAGLLLRPFRLPEAVWAVAGAVLVVGMGLLPIRQAWVAVIKGTDVYLFLTGMMLLSEIARREGLFDWVAGHAVNAASGSSFRLFTLVYGVGIAITTFLSNDATAVVLTPAVLAATRKARIDPLPFLLICAFIANAASFVLPISNPANLVLYGGHTPPLWQWIQRFAVPSVLSIATTYLALWLTQRGRLGPSCKPGVAVEVLGAGGITALLGLCVTAAVLMLVSFFDVRLGLPTAILGMITVAVVLRRRKTSPIAVIRGVSWSVLPLVAGLFVLVEALDHIGVIADLAVVLGNGALRAEGPTAAVAGGVIALGSNVVNNLPAGLVAASTVADGKLPQRLIDCLLIGVDLGPNLSVTGSLATILWLQALRRDNQDVGFWKFLGVGLAVMPPALVLAITARLV